MDGAGVLRALLEPRGLALAFVALSVQTALQRRFKRAGPFQRQPGFAAHQLVCLPLMLPVVAAGVAGWAEARSRSSLGPAERIYAPDAGGLLTAQISIAVGIWDLPTYLATPELRTPVMLTHHAVTLALQVLVVAKQFMQHYASFFFGVTELSTLPLLILDLFHPKHFPELGDARPTLNLAARGCFALSFLAVRVLYWPFVLAGVWADLVWELRAGSGATPAPVLICVLAGSAFLTGLQYHWGFLILRQVASMLFPKPESQAE